MLQNFNFCFSYKWGQILPDLLQLWPWHNRIVMNCPPTSVILVILAVYNSTRCKPRLLKNRNKFLYSKPWMQFKSFHPFVCWYSVLFTRHHFFYFILSMIYTLQSTASNTLLQVNEFHKYNENTWGPSVIRDIYLTCTHSSHPVISGKNTANVNKRAHACWVCYFSIVRCTITKTLCSRISIKDFYMHVTFNLHEVRSILLTDHCS